MVYPYSSANRTVNQNNIDYSKQKGDAKSSVPTTVNSNQINYSTIGGNFKATDNPNTITSKESHGDNVDLWKINMGKEANFTVQIDGIAKPNMKHKSKNVDWGQFLPIKSINYTPVAIETLKLKAGIFTDLPIPVGRRIGKIDLTFQDTEDHYFENQFYNWYSSMIPDSNGYVGYFEDMVKKFTYTEFDNKGKTVKTYYMEVIMDGDLKVDRSYDNNNLKSFTVTLLIVGIITASSRYNIAID